MLCWPCLRGLPLCFRPVFFLLALTKAAEVVPWRCFDDESCLLQVFACPQPLVRASVLPWHTQGQGGWKLECWLWRREQLELDMGE